ncbi:MAG: geranylgeranyl pyrophosphate synthase, partial [Rhizobiales bacterium 35-66-30]
MSLPLPARLEAAAALAQARLDRALADSPLPGERLRPKRLMEAIRHGSLDGGKRLRPFLVLETAALFGLSPDAAVTAAAAVECVHCYSLVHDDLPAMDNDVLRRGRPTVHIAFGEATAILAGDALLTLAFDLLAGEDTHPDAAVRIALVSALARAAGMGGMVGGQMLDLAAEGRFADGAPLALSMDEIRDLQ